MENKRLYSLIGQLALNYRLSLSNVCRLLGKNTDDKTRMEVYETILSITEDRDARDAYDFLFNYETVNESQKNSSLAFTKAAMFLKKYINAQKTNNKEEINALNGELVKIEKDFNQLFFDYKNVKETKTPSSEEITIISRYRLKHRISQMQMSKNLGISREVVSNAEKKITDPLLMEKLQLLSDYFQDSTVNLYPRKK